MMVRTISALNILAKSCLLSWWPKMVDSSGRAAASHTCLDSSSKSTNKSITCAQSHPSQSIFFSSPSHLHLRLYHSPRHLLPTYDYRHYQCRHHIYHRHKLISFPDIFNAFEVTNYLSLSYINIRPFAFEKQREY